MKLRFRHFLFRYIFWVILSVLWASCGTVSGGKSRDYPFRTQKEQQEYLALYNKTLALFPGKVIEMDVPTRFGKAHLITQGNPENPVLLLLHGMDASSTMWYPNLNYWSQTHYVIAIDYIMDCGKSQLTTGILSKSDIVQFYSDILNYLNIKTCSVLGTSRGGWIAAYLGIKIPNRIDKLVLLSPAQVFGMVKPRIVPAIRFKLFPSKSNLRSTLTTFSEYPDTIAPEFQNQFLYASQHGKSLPQLLHMTPFSKSKLKQLQMPVYFLAGDRDVMNGKRALNKAQKYVPQIEISVFEKCGHFMSTDQVDKTNRLVHEFLNGNTTTDKP